MALRITSIDYATKTVTFSEDFKEPEHVDSREEVFALNGKRLRTGMTIEADLDENGQLINVRRVK